jgi:cysteine-rich repeat protein
MYRFAHPLIWIAPLALGFFAACGGDDDTPPPPPSGTKPTIETLTADPAAGMIGGKTTLSWTTKNAERVRVLKGTTELFMSSEMVASGSAQVDLTEASNVFTLEASKGSDVVTKSITVMATGTGADPVISSFNVSPRTWGGAMQSVMIVWQTQNAAMVKLQANGTDVSAFPGGAMGTFTMTIMDTTTFKLIASGNGKMVERMVTSERFGTEMEPNDSQAQAQPLALQNGMGMAEGSLNPEGDEDWYAIVVPEGGNIIARTASPGGDCDIDTVLTLYGPSGEGLGDNDDVNYQQMQVCSEINAVFDEFARSLAAGTYYLVVRGYEDDQGNSVTGDYVLNVEVRAPGCGNEIREPAQNEQCDDGNMAAMDGCSATCQAEIAGMLRGPPASQTFSGMLGQSASSWIELTLTATSWVRAETFVPMSPGCMGPDNDTVLLIYDSSFEVIFGQDDIDGQAGNTCSRIDPSRDPDVPLLAAGTYYLQVLAYPGTSVRGYEVRVEVFAPGCGNQVIEEMEVCDDGNSMAGDGCNAMCRPEPSGTINPPGTSTVVSFRSETDVRAYTVRITAPGQSLTATVGDTMGCEPYPSLILYDSNWTELGRSEPFAIQGMVFCAQLAPDVTAFANDLAVGTYYLVVANGVHLPPASVALELGISNARCGDGALSTRAGETCDDKNATSGDGCSNMCRFEPSAMLSLEMEPNDTFQTANTASVAVGSMITVGGTVRRADDDWFRVVVPQGQTATLVARTYGRLGDLNSCNGDTVLALVDAFGDTLVENDDRDMNTLCSQIDGEPAAMGLAAGTYYLWVKAYARDSVIPAYYLDIDLR